MTLPVVSPGTGNGAGAGVSVELNKPDWLVQMEGILETLNEGVIIVDDCHRIIFVNDCLCEMTQFEARDLLGRTPERLYQGSDLEFIRQQVARRELEGRTRFEFFLPRKDGGRVPTIISSRQIEDPDGREFAVITFTDISEQKEAERKLREANQQLEERQEEIERELALASRVQQSLTPQSVRWGQVAVEAFYSPVDTIGGDFGLVTPLSDGRLNLLVCDVSGHGISSALVANRIYSEMVALLERRAEVAEMLRRLNTFVLQQIQVSGFYFSLAAARLDPSGRRLTFASAGHPPAMWVRPGGDCRLLETRSMVLGLLENAVGEDPTVELELLPGDRLVLYTDGLTEVFDHREEMLGIRGLQTIVCESARQPLAEMKQTILHRIEAWRHGPHTDDMSLVVAEVL